MEKVKQYLLNNLEEARMLVSAISSWNGCLQHLDVYENDEEFFNMCFEGNPMEAVRAAHYGEYNYNDDYVRFNGYGNLESLSEYQLEEELKESIDEIIDNLLSNINDIDVSEELNEILEQEQEA